MLLGTRYPTLAFYTGGAGQADDGIPPQPFDKINRLIVCVYRRIYCRNNIATISIFKINRRKYIILTNYT